MKRAVFLTLGVGLGLLARPADAQMPEVIEWMCGLESPRAESIRCQLSEPVPGYYAAAGNQPLDRRQIMADLFRPGASRNLARLVREAPQRYAGETWWIPLYRAPTDMALAGELARSVMCGNDPACRVAFIGSGSGTMAFGAAR